MNPACNVSLVASSTATNTPLYPCKKTTKKTRPGAVILTFTALLLELRGCRVNRMFFLTAGRTARIGLKRYLFELVWGSKYLKWMKPDLHPDIQEIPIHFLLSPQFNVVAKILIIRFWNSRLTVLLKNIFASFFQSLNSGHILKLIMNVSFMPQLVGKS